MVQSVVQQITSRDNPLLVRLRKQSSDPGGYRRAQALWIEGPHLCEACVQAGWTPSLAVTSQAGWQDAALQALALRAPRVIVVPQPLMNALSALESPAPLAFEVPWRGPGTIQPDAPSVVLDRLQDPGNVGNVLRSAAAFGFTQVIAVKGTVALWSSKVLRAAMGAHFGLHLVELGEVSDLDALSTPLWATGSHAPQTLHEAVLTWPCSWVLGHEGQGVSASLQRACAGTLRIEQPGGQESLNVAAAAAVCLYESARQRLSRR